MIKRSFIREEAEIKKIFKSVEIEKPSADFTISVMERISKETITLPVKKSPYLRLLYLLFIPFFIGIYFSAEITNWVTQLEAKIMSINLAPEKTWLSELFNNMKIITSPAILSIVLASLMLLALFVWVNSKNIAKE